MIQRARKFINLFAGKPEKLFLIDSLGALLTTFLLFVVLRSFNESFGMPPRTLTYLAAIAACFCLYSAACAFLLKENHRPFLSGIGLANLLYCSLTMCLLLIYNQQLTFLGITYFLVEILIVCALVYLELSVALAIKKNGMAKRHWGISFNEGCVFITSKAVYWNKFPEAKSNGNS